jgi:hypothetical protein
MSTLCNLNSASPYWRVVLNELNSWVRCDNVTFPVYWVKGGAAGKYQIYGIPMILLIKNGEIVDRIPGQRSEKFLEKKIEGLLELE